MRKKTELGMILTFLIICASTSALYVRPVMAAPQISILTHSGWLDSESHYHVSGEVENLGDAAANSITITGTFYDSSNEVVATEFTFTEIDVLLPGRKTPFEVILTNNVQSSAVNHYALRVEFLPADPIPEGLQIVANSSYTDARGIMYIDGGIMNVASETQTSVKVVATFYDSTRNVVASGYAYSDPMDVGAGKTGLFEILLTYTERVPLVASYSLTAQSQQYVEVPEFPSVIVLPLFAILTLISICLLKRIRPRPRPLHSARPSNLGKPSKES